ncbi:tRNA (adenosine(37)-N6)-threonylcarbamoyltransferase complex dimerization subunit type 1 TsaB [Shewanella gelidii]|uniref:tRNA threonylcarbamoyladenosine biosynthesis protein TsaB n=1 Tax=Shewanella gelidii TaxID=1642821 RepID=A0A917JTM9_9GAMM|nr:tRNA (adenosine(37)-N6)-threonylcarbamoyltransferase complex dimerization subunit type 1 TsaB [Shewanella gelidii]MCL1098635.1 tRNA (adenosine(37)-N6)-threonylcarbamoyltransferase complex dimerization subunit type 1 TsaB [Shewanella gelidii]GGI86450.1 tRNA (adenosine(37)-N6)-threonylcarbamoyltransferase complex dimerization subunit type 1 TsaB [Shewanella gelidii]
MSIEANSQNTVLALDTCTEMCSVAICHHGQVFSQIQDAPREHSQRLLPMVQDVLEQASLKLSDIDVIAYGRGPGSFTGIRICTSMTQGLALGQELPVIGISTLAAMAQAAIASIQAQQVIAAIDARMGEIYVAQFVNDKGIAKLVGQEQVCAPDHFCCALDKSLPIHICGTGFDAYPELIGNQVLVEAAKYPNAANMLPLAAQGIAANQTTTVDELAPIYLRDTVTWKKLPGRE